MDFYKLRRDCITAYDPGGCRTRSRDCSPSKPKVPEPTPAEIRQKRDRPDEIRSGIDDILEGKVEGVEIIDYFGLKKAIMKRD